MQNFAGSEKTGQGDADARKGSAYGPNVLPDQHSPMTANLMPILRGWLSPLRRLALAALALVLITNLSACSGILSSDARDAARTVVQVAKTAADATGNEQLKSVLTPVLNVLNATEKEVKADNITAATSTISKFRGLWDTAAPVVKLAAGDNYGLIDTGVKLVLKTFGGDTAPSKDNALTALTGLIGPLKALLG